MGKRNPFDGTALSDWKPYMYDAVPPGDHTYQVVEFVELTAAEAAAVLAYHTDKAVYLPPRFQPVDLTPRLVRADCAICVCFGAHPVDFAFVVAMFRFKSLAPTSAA